MPRVLLSILLFGWLYAPTLCAQPTALDLSFSQDGELLNPFPALPLDAGGTRLLRLGLDHDERILVAGWNSTANSTHAVVGRLLANGSPDPAWAGSGVSVLDQRPGMRVADLVALPDGGAIVCGNYAAPLGANRTWVFVARLQANGQLDTRFASASSTPGIYFAEPAGFDDFSCRALELLADGRVMVAGASFIAASKGSSRHSCA